MNERLKEHFDKYDAFLKENAEFDFNSTVLATRDEFNRLSSSCQDEDISSLLKWDSELFSCCEIHISERQKKGFLFPEFVFANGACMPDIKNFEKERVDFYGMRLTATRNFVLRNRYLNYLVEYAPKVERYQHVKNLCQETLIYLADKPLSFDFRSKFERLTELALQFNIADNLDAIKQMLESKIVDTVIDPEHILDQNNDSSWGLLTISQCLREFRDKRSQLLTVKANQMLIAHLDFCKNRCDIRSKDVFIRELLYWARIENGDVLTLAREYGKYYETLAEADESFLATVAHYESALKIYLENGLPDEIAPIKVKIKDAQRKLSASDEMQVHQFNFQIPESVADQLNKMVTNFTEGVNATNVADYLPRLTVSFFTPAKTMVESQAKTSAINSVLPMIASLNSMQNGRSVFIGNDAEDWELYFFAQTYGILLNAQFQIFHKIWCAYSDAGMTAETIAQFLRSRDFISVDQQTIIDRGIERLFAGDYISAIHILVPHYEGAFRRFFEYYGYPTTGVSSDGTQKEQTFTEFLKNEFVKVLPEDYLYLVDYVMVGQLGLNLRNNVAHGLIETHVINKMTALIVLYIYFVLFGFEIVENNEPVAEEPTPEI